jgi:TonB family protein
MPVRPLRLAPEWDDRFTRMVVVSAVAHAAVIVATIWVVAHPGEERPLPLVAYTVEITDPNALGGRLPPGAPGKTLTGGPTTPPGLQGRTEPAAPAPAEPKPEPKPPEPPPAEAKPPEPKPVEAKPVEPPPPPPQPKPAEAKPPEPKPEEPTVSLERKPTPPPEPKKVEPPKPEPKPQVAKAEPPKPAPEPKKPEPAKPEAKAEPAKPAAAKPEPAKPDAKVAAKDAHAPAGKEGAARDDYAAAAERWRSRPDKPGGGLGGEGGSGPIGAGGEGPGGGGQLVGIEFLAYRQQVINTVKARWANVIARPGLVTAIRFEIGPNGEVGTIKIEHSSGNPAYDASATRAVQRANPLPAPPSKYAHDFSEFVIEFHSEEQGGQGAG